jgi:wyosine [tRNA(Phe)-imidazoG37] synthetase (radical SAM superfamily)
MTSRRERSLGTIPNHSVSGESAFDCAISLVYGPVQSRRFGRSLGVNLLPVGLRLCTFDCRYCQCGGRPARWRNPSERPFPTLEALEQALTGALSTERDVDDICFAGAGEPTLHPQFREAVILVGALRSRLAPRASVTILSNGVAAAKPEVRAALALADRAVLKLDAARDDLLRDLNCGPRGLSASRLIRSYAGMIGIETQTVLVRGAVENATPDALDALGEALRLIHPRRAQVGTITRAPAAARIGPAVLPLSPAALQAAVARLRRAAPAIEIAAY